MAFESINDLPVYVVVCTTDGCYDLSYDAVYGYETTIFSERDDALARAHELSTSGDWPEQPEYEVIETTLSEAAERWPRSYGLWFQAGIQRRNTEAS